MQTSFHHQPEAQHPKSSTIHKLGRPITPSLVGGLNRSTQHFICRLIRFDRPTKIIDILGIYIAIFLACRRHGDELRL